MFASLPTFRAMNVEYLDYISIIALLRAAEDFGTIGVENSPIVVKEGKINVFFRLWSNWFYILMLMVQTRHLCSYTSTVSLSKISDSSLT